MSTPDFGTDMTPDELKLAVGGTHDKHKVKCVLYYGAYDGRDVAGAIVEFSDGSYGPVDPCVASKLYKSGDFPAKLHVK
jgi:hypothetical protein